jgi:hypothetical protein
MTNASPCELAMLQGLGQLGPIVLLAALGLRVLGQEFPVPAVQELKDGLPLCLDSETGLPLA